MHLYLGPGPVVESCPAPSAGLSRGAPHILPGAPALRRLPRLPLAHGQELLQGGAQADIRESVLPPARTYLLRVQMLEFAINCNSSDWPWPSAAARRRASNSGGRSSTPGRSTGGSSRPSDTGYTGQGDSSNFFLTQLKHFLLSVKLKGLLGERRHRQRPHLLPLPRRSPNHKPRLGTQIQEGEGVRCL